MSAGRSTNQVALLDGEWRNEAASAATWAAPGATAPRAARRRWAGAGSRRSFRAAPNCGDRIARARQRVGRQPPLEREHVGGIRLAVVIGVEQQRGWFGFAQGSVVMVRLVRSRRSSDCARASRDITVPTGTSVTAAISR